MISMNRGNYGIILSVVVSLALFGATESRAQGNVLTVLDTVAAPGGTDIMVVLDLMNDQDLSRLSVDLTFPPGLCAAIANRNGGPEITGVIVQNDPTIANSHDMVVEGVDRAAVPTSTPFEQTFMCSDGTIPIRVLSLVGGAVIPAGMGAVFSLTFDLRGDALEQNFVFSPTNIVATNTSSTNVPVTPQNGTFAIEGMVVPIPTLPQWGMILLVLSLLTIATWQLAGQPALLGMRSTGGTYLTTDHRWVSSLLLGQGVAALGLLFYGALVAPLVPHDGLGALLSGLLIGSMIECYQRGRAVCQLPS